MIFWGAGLRSSVGGYRSSKEPAAFILRTKVSSFMAVKISDLNKIGRVYVWRTLQFTLRHGL
jgi:hypothetical protein